MCVLVLQHGGGTSDVGSVIVAEGVPGLSLNLTSSLLCEVTPVELVASEVVVVVIVVSLSLVVVVVVVASQVVVRSTTSTSTACSVATVVQSFDGALFVCVRVVV